MLSRYSYACRRKNSCTCTKVLGLENIHILIVNILWLKIFYLKFYFCILCQSFFFYQHAVSFPIAKVIPYMCYLNCSRPERFDEFFMNGFHRLLFWSDVSCLWWLIKQWIITALAITCDKNMAWVQMTGFFFLYISILLLGYIRREDIW